MGSSGSYKVSDAAARSEASLDDLGGRCLTLNTLENDYESNSPISTFIQHKKRKYVIDEEEIEEPITLIRSKNKGKGRLIPLGTTAIARFFFCLYFELTDFQMMRRKIMLKWIMKTSHQLLLVVIRKDLLLRLAPGLRNSLRRNPRRWK